jgi:hypothetical protein
MDNKGNNKITQLRTPNNLTTGKSKLIITTGKLWKWFGKYRRKLWKGRENMEENGEKIGKIWKKIVKWFENYGRKASQMVKRFGKYRRKYWKDRENMEVISEMIWKIWKKIVKWYGKYGSKVSRIVIRYR